MEGGRGRRISSGTRDEGGLMRVVPGVRGSEPVDRLDGSVADRPTPGPGPAWGQGLL